MAKMFWLVVVIAWCYTLQLLVSTVVDSADMNVVLRVQGGNSHSVQGLLGEMGVK